MYNDDYVISLVPQMVFMKDENELIIVHKDHLRMTKKRKDKYPLDILLLDLKGNCNENGSSVTM